MTPETIQQCQVALIGCGPWGMNLVRNFASLGVLHTVCDSDNTRLRTIAPTYPHVKCETNLQRVLLDPETNVVVVATPAVTHCAVAGEALLAGKDVFVEKPLALNRLDGERLVRLAAQKQRLLMVGHLLEYHPAVVKLKEMISADELGQIQYIYSNRLNLGRVRREENILWSFAPHDIAVILRLIGTMPLEICATGGAYLRPDVADVTVMNLLFENGVRAHIFVSWLHPYKEHRLVVVGSKKMAVLNDTVMENKLILYDQQVDLINGELVQTRHEGRPVELDSIEPLRAECQHLIECVKSRHQPRTDGLSGLRVLQVLEAGQKSLTAQGKPVQLESAQLEVVTV